MVAGDRSELKVIDLGIAAGKNRILRNRLVEEQTPV